MSALSEYTTATTAQSCRMSGSRSCTPFVNPILFTVFMGVYASHAKRHLNKFWGMAKYDDPMRSSLQHGHESMHAFIIPGWTHGDGVPCTKRDTLDT